MSAPHRILSPGAWPRAGAAGFRGTRLAAAATGLFAAGLLAAVGSVHAQPSGSGGDATRTLEALLQETREARASESAEHRKREAAFLAERNKQKQRVAEAEARLRAAEKRSEALSKRFDKNEQELAALQQEIDTKAGAVGELFGVYRQVAGDTAGVLEASLTSVQFPERRAFLRQLAERDALPSIDELEGLWLEMLREMTASGQTVRFEAPVVATDGEVATTEVVRAGPFTAVSDAGFLGYLPDAQQYFVLPRQPERAHRRAAEQLFEADAGAEGAVPAVVDPTRGSLLATLVQRPSVREYFDAGGLVGRIIAVLALIGFGIGLWRAAMLWRLSAAVRDQRGKPEAPREDNPLGRVLSVYRTDAAMDTESLQLKLDDAVLREVPAVERGLGTLKVLAAVGPLLGLLGTVTGMILTFQQITLFGTGDPRLMADGISQALVTTVLGLIMAIPLVLLHSALRARSDAIVQVLEEQSAGMVAELAEARSA